MAGGNRTIGPVGGVSGDAVMILPDRGKGAKRTIYIHVYNSQNVTVFFAHDRQTLLQSLSVSDANLGTQAGIPVGKNGGSPPFTFLDWEGPMWAVASAAAVISYEEANA